MFCEIDLKLLITGMIMEYVRMGYEDTIIIGADSLCDYIRMLSARTGYAIFNDTTESELIEFLSRYYKLFTRVPHTNYFYLNSSLENPIKTVLSELDPPLNYPIDLLKNMQLIEED